MRSTKGICYMKHTCEPGYLIQKANYTIDFKESSITLSVSNFIGIKNLDNQSSIARCTKTCICPKWAHACSYYKGILSRQIILTPVQKAQLDKLKIKDICVLATKKIANKDEMLNECDKSKKLVKYGYVVETYDGNIHFLTELKIRKVQIVDKHDYYCYPNEKNSLKNSFSGTPEFCENFKCVKDGTKFCYYDLLEAFLMRTNLIDVEIPIYAYAYSKIEYYGHNINDFKIASLISESVESNRSVNDSIYFKVNCTYRGILIRNLTATSFTICRQIKCIGNKKYCGKTICQKYKNVNTTEYDVILEESFTIYDYYYQIKLKNKHIDGDCPAVSICKRINCLFCKKLRDNPHCLKSYEISPVIVIIIVSIVIMIGVIIIILFIFIKYRKTNEVKVAYKKGEEKIDISRENKNKKQNTELDKKELEKNETDENIIELESIETISNAKLKYESLSKGKKILRKKSFIILPKAAINICFFLILVLYLLATINGECHKVTSLTASEHTCSVNKNNIKTCYFSETTLLTLLPNQLTCLDFSDGNQTLGTMTLEIDEIRSECKKKNEYYTRNYEFDVRASKRCPWVGECHGNTCSEMKTDHKSSEFSEDVNNKPGFTFCRDGCGCWGCHCLSCASACIIYRVFSKPIGDVVYEVFSCNSFTNTLKSKVNLNIKENITTRSIELFPGNPTDIGDMTLVLTSEISPKLPILNKKFLTDNDKLFSLIEIEDQIKVKCGNLEKAKSFDCTFPIDEGKCRVTDPDVKCEFQNSPIKSIIENTQGKLPLKLEDVDIKTENRTVIAIMKQSSVIQIQITMKNMKISTVYENNKCNLKVKDFKGCFNCNNGAKLKYYCKTDFGSALGELKCPGLSPKRLECTNTVNEKELTLEFEVSDIDIECTLTCPGSTNKVKLKGVLDFIEYKPIGSQSILAKDEAKDKGVKADIDIWSSIKNLIKANLGKVLIIIGVFLGIIGLIITIVLIPYIVPLIPMCMTCCRKEKIIIDNSKIIDKNKETINDILKDKEEIELRENVKTKKILNVDKIEPL